VGAPARRTGDGEQGGIKLHRYAQHAIYEAGVHIHVGTHGDGHMLALHDKLYAYALHIFHQLQLLQPSLVRGQFSGVFFYHHGSGVGHGVYRVAQTVYLAGLVAVAAVQQLRQVAAQLGIVVIVGHVGLYVAEHLHYLGVGAAVERALQGTYGRGDCAVCVGAGGGHAAAGEGGVVAAAVVGVEHQHHVQDVGFLVGVALVRAHHAQEVLRQGQLRLRIVDIQRVAQQVVPHDGIGVGHDKRHPRHDLHRLAQHVGGGSVVGAGVVGIQGQHAPGQLVHEIVGRSLEDNVLGEADGQISGLGQQSLEAVKLGLVGQLAQQQKIHGLLIAEGAGFQVCLHNVRGIDASVIKLARHWDALAVYNGVALHAAHARDADDDAGAVGIAQAALYVHMCVLFVVYAIRGHNVGIQLLQVLGKVKVG